MRIKGILLMGGKGTRAGGKIPKQFLNLAGRRTYRYALDTFLSCKKFAEILLVTPIEWLKTVEREISDLATPFTRIRVIEGGKRRQESSYRALIACGEGTDAVVIHDAMRPLLSPEILEANLSALNRYAAINTCIPTTDTIVHAPNPKIVKAIPNRSEYWLGQTPQSFSYPLILEAHQRNAGGDFSDDCRLIIEQNQPVHIILGSESNIKITSSSDFSLAEQLLNRKGAHASPSRNAPLQGKVFAITGGTGGIGSALSLLLEKEGATPLIISTSSPHYPVDLTSSANAQNLFENIHQTHGFLDGLINCIGVLTRKPFYELSSREIDKLIASNFHAPLYSCRYAQIKKGGHIINLSSSSYLRGRKTYTLYSSAKAAIVNFTQGLAEERTDLQINAIIPQRTDTPLRQTNFPDEDPSLLLSPEEVAQQILFILKKSAATGISFEIRKK